MMVIMIARVTMPVMMVIRLAIVMMMLILHMVKMMVVGILAMGGVDGDDGRDDDGDAD